MVSGRPVVVVREFDAHRDCAGVEAVEGKCVVGSSTHGKLALLTDLLGDPICRVRHFPAFLMLVAEVTGPAAEGEIVGVIRGCIKTVTCGQRASGPVPIYTKLAYVLGLRVSPSHRRMGIGLRLVKKMEDWFRKKGAEYSYMATDKDNEASLHLFTGRCGYSKFRTPSILVQPVFAHSLRVPRRVSVLRLPTTDAESLYRRRFAAVEFFPRDIDAILRNPLSLGTFVAVERGGALGAGGSWTGTEAFLADPPASWAVLSVWNCKDVFRLQVRGASLAKRLLAKASRTVDSAFPWLRIPSVPDLFRPFGLYFLYGVGGEGPAAARLLAALCAHSHNMARLGGCGVVATEVAGRESLRAGIPHWRRLSTEDLWCMKRLSEDDSDGSVGGDWTRAPPGPSIFVDPREI